jgi:hypothetical protein
VKTKAISTSGGTSPRFRIILQRLGWLAIVLPSILFSVNSSFTSLSSYSSDLEKWVYVYLNFGSFIAGVIAALIIFWRRKADWLALTVSLMLVTWTSTSNGFDFWMSMDISGNADINWWIAYFLSTSYTLLLSILLLSVLLTFPNGRWVPGWTRWLFLLSLLGMVILPIYLCIMIFLMKSMPENLRSILIDKLP